MRSFRQLLPNWSQVLAKVMGTSNRVGSDVLASPQWRAFYLAALFETDEKQVGQRILDAKKALVGRARELFPAAGDHIQEETAIDEAFQTLHTLERLKYMRLQGR